MGHTFASLRGIFIGLAALLAGCQTTTVSGPDIPTFLETHALTEIVVNYSQTQEPLAVPGIERAFRKGLVGTSTAGKIATSLRFKNNEPRRQALVEGINKTIVPHVTTQLVPMFKGTRPMRAEIMLVSAFLRSKFRNVTGLARFQFDNTPTEDQLIAGIRLYDVETGIPVQEVAPVKFVSDGAVTLFGANKVPPYDGPAPRFNKLAFEYSTIMAQAVGQYAGRTGAYITAEEARTKILGGSGRTF